MERHFDEELKSLGEKILYMGSLVEAMVHNATTGLKELDESLLQKVFKKENEINALHLEIDELCLQLIALRQPMAVDLRFITAAMKINSELERMGDQAVNISQNTIEFIKQPKQKMLNDLDEMANLVKEMVKGSLDAFVKKDPMLAKTVLLKDDRVDNLKSDIFHELLNDFKICTTASIDRTFELILISRNLEKIADHATNICEDVIFMVLGKDIRHHYLNLDKNNK